MNTIIQDTLSDHKLTLLGEALLMLAGNPSVVAEAPELEQYAEKYRISMKENDADETEIAFLNLYCALHRVGDAYTQSERQILDKKKGYFNHPGGISPLVKAEKFIKPDSIVVDLGAGNGLQGLLFQYLYPHKETRLVELSAEMIRIGRMFQQVFAFGNDRIKWVHDDILNISLIETDFVYLYRPSKPSDDGYQLYHAISDKLASRKGTLTIFSIADCLKDFLDSSFSIFYSDGHLTCFEKK